MEDPSSVSKAAFSEPDTAPPSNPVSALQATLLGSEESSPNDPPPPAIAASSSSSGEPKKSEAPPTPAGRCVLEDYTRCSECLLWRLMSEYYDRNGVEAWR